MRSGIIVLILISFLQVSAQNKKPVTIEYKKFGKYNYELYANNAMHYPFQIMLDFPTFKNMVCDHDIPVITTLMPGKKLLCKVYRDTLENKSEFKWNYKFRMGAFPANPDTLMPYALPIDYGKKTTFMEFEDLGGKGRYTLSFSVEESDTIRAIAPGVVAIANDSASLSGFQQGASADNFILVHQPGHTFARYEVLMNHGALVTEGDEIKAGDAIAIADGSNYDMGPHVKLTVYHSKKNIKDAIHERWDKNWNYLKPRFVTKKKKDIVLKNGKEYQQVKN